MFCVAIHFRNLSRAAASDSGDAGPRSLPVGNTLQQNKTIIVWIKEQEKFSEEHYCCQNLHSNPVNLFSIQNENLYRFLQENIHPSRLVEEKCLNSASARSRITQISQRVRHLNSSYLSRYFDNRSPAPLLLYVFSTRFRPCSHLLWSH